jgi:transcriptional regulator GlxA family with amidase domain
VFARAERLVQGSYDLVFASQDGRDLITSAGLVLAGVRTLSRVRGTIDTLLVAGGSEAALRLAIDNGLAKTVAQMAPRIRRIGSVCTGAFVLGAAGLLDGRRATTHWGACQSLATLFPSALIEPDAIHVADPPVFTSAGVSAGIDLALALVESDLGHAVAAQIARDMVLYLRRPGGQAQYSTVLRSQAEAPGVLTALIAWMSGGLTDDLSVAALARRANMSERTFVREFKKKTGTTAAAHVRRIRIEHARGWLETTDWPIKRVADRSGFGSEDSLTRAMRAELGITPAVLRARFRKLKG